MQVTTPPGYRPGVPAPLLLVLHGYGDTPAGVDRYLGLGPVAAAAGMLYATPSGTPDSNGRLFWNATEACCDLQRTGVDDAAYLNSVIREIRARHTVDERRVHVVGVSNGGFMAHRLACDHAEVVATVVSMGGGGVPDERCRPSRSVTVLQIHGDADSVVAYGGATQATGILAAAYPGAPATAGGWASRNGCAPGARAGGSVDLATAADANAPGARPLDGAETRVQVYDGGCRPGGHVELWTVVGGDHAVVPSRTFAQEVVGFLGAHPRP